MLPILVHDEIMVSLETEMYIGLPTVCRERCSEILEHK